MLKMILKTFLFEIFFMILILSIQLIYISLSYEIDFYQNEIFYLLILELFLFILYILLKWLALRKSKGQTPSSGFTSDPYLKESLLKTIDENTSLLEQIEHLKNEQGDILDIIYSYIHELKTPLTSLKLLLKDHSSNYSLEIFRLEEIINKLLYSAKLKDLKNDVFIKTHSIEDLLKDLLKKYKTQFIFKNIRLVTKITDFPVYSDYKWLLFALSQIISNSLKYTGHQGEITLSTSISSNKKTISIRDNGIGIRQEYLHRIFDRGFSLDPASRQYKGTGIGLYITREILNSLNMKIEVKSAEGEYTEFIVIFQDHADFFNI